jgi:hypothetical protein
MIAITAAINGTKVEFQKIDCTRRLRPVFPIVLEEVNLTSLRAGSGFSAVTPPEAGRRTQATLIRYDSRYLERLFICGHLKQCGLVIVQLPQYFLTVAFMIFQIGLPFGNSCDRIVYETSSLYITPN